MVGPGQTQAPPKRVPRPVAEMLAARQLERQRRLRRRALPLAVLAGAALIAGAISAAGSPDEEMAERFVRAWAEQDFAAMHRELSADARSRYPRDTFTSAYQDAQTTSTATAIDPGGAADENGAVTVEADVRTRLFGLIDGELRLPVSDGEIDWRPHLVFPGLEEGERLARRLDLPQRASILARDRTPLAAGASRSSPLGSAAIDIAGVLGEPVGELRAKVEQAGYPGDVATGISGLELAFNSRLAGRPGGELLAVAGEGGEPDVSASTEGRVLASAERERGEPVRTTIEPDLQRVTVAALGGQFGGVAVLDAKSGAVRALAGSAFLAPQPPGSTFKLVTTVAALEERKVKLSDTFPVVSEINAGGRVIANAHDELCGGNFVQAFAHSCNTVFAPLGVEVGEEKLVEVAERFGFNETPALYDQEAAAAVGLPQSTIPEDPGDTVDLAASAIGQGQVLATPLQLASMSQAIANRGIRSPTSIVTDPALMAAAEPVQVTSPENARVLRGLMLEVVNSGTGTAAALPGVDVAGKTGTAELGPKENAPPPEPGEQPEQEVDAWFTAFAPASKPRLAVAVMLVHADGDGGEVAAPIAREILAAALL